MIQNLSFLGIAPLSKTGGWYRVVKDNSVGMRLPQCQSSVLSIFQIDPIHCILVHFPLRSGRYLSWFCHVARFVFFVVRSWDPLTVKKRFPVLFLNLSLLQSGQT